MTESPVSVESSEAARPPWGESFIEELEATQETSYLGLSQNGKKEAAYCIHRYAEELIRKAEKAARNADPYVDNISQTFVEKAAQILAGSPKSRAARHIGLGVGGIAIGGAVSAGFSLWFLAAQKVPINEWMLGGAVLVAVGGVLLYSWGMLRG
ncbi:MAG: hypothetical protein WBG92_23805 [Thiohalocapsa sp.]